MQTGGSAGLSGFKASPSGAPAGPIALSGLLNLTSMDALITFDQQMQFLNPNANDAVPWKFYDGINKYTGVGSMALSPGETQIGLNISLVGADLGHAVECEYLNLPSRIKSKSTGIKYPATMGIPLVVSP